VILTIFQKHPLEKRDELDDDVVAEEKSRDKALCYVMLCYVGSFGVISAASDGLN